MALAAPDQGSALVVAMYQYFNYSSASSCAKQYDGTAYGPVLTQVAAYADVGGYDGQVGSPFVSDIALHVD